MSKSQRKIVVFVLVIVVLIFLYRSVFHTPEPAIEPSTVESTRQLETRFDDSNSGIQQRLEKRMEERLKRAEELRGKGAGQFPVKIEDKKHTEAVRLYRRALTESKIAIERTADYKRMVDYCRWLLREYPDSPQAVEAKKLLGQMPARDREEYNITENEIRIQNSN